MTKHQWQYNGIAPMYTLVAWCRKHIPNEFVYDDWDTIVFLTGRAKTLFLLRWSGS